MAKSCCPDAGRTSVCLIRAPLARRPQEQLLQHPALPAQIREVSRRAAAEEHGSLLLAIITPCIMALLDIFGVSNSFVLVHFETLKCRHSFCLLSRDTHEVFGVSLEAHL